ncbi:xylosidase [Anopheles sinensis]|uniref:Xylosidase n=1 Tax=Anopheles sinensis TaxID=74873 RepID=A0A084VQH1_ANOSI|nr:xylosidase [Anopheles sinensis]
MQLDHLPPECTTTTTTTTAPAASPCAAGHDTTINWRATRTPRYLPKNSSRIGRWMTGAPPKTAGPAEGGTRWRGACGMSTLPVYVRRGLLLVLYSRAERSTERKYQQWAYFLFLLSRTNEFIAFGFPDSGRQTHWLWQPGRSTIVSDPRLLFCCLSMYLLLPGQAEVPSEERGVVGEGDER